MLETNVEQNKIIKIEGTPSPITVSNQSHNETESQEPNIHMNLSQYNPYETTIDENTHKIIRRRIIKKTVYVDGQPLEKEEFEELPEEMADHREIEALVSSSDITSPVHRIIRRRVVKKIVYVDGKPTETEEVFEEPEEITDESIKSELLQGDLSVISMNEGDSAVEIVKIRHLV